MSSTRSRSPPALNAPSAPRTTTARVSSSSPIVFQTFASSPCVAASTALSRPGLRSVSRRTCGAGRSSSRPGYAAYRSSTRRTLEVELGRHELERHRSAAAVEVDRDGRADAVADHQLLHVVDARDRDAVDGDDQVLGPQPGYGGRRALDDLDHLDSRGPAELVREVRWEGPRVAGDSEVRAPEPAVAHQRGDDRARRVVDRHGE